MSHFTRFPLLSASNLQKLSGAVLLAVTLIPGLGRAQSAPPSPASAQSRPAPTAPSQAQTALSRHEPIAENLRNTPLGQSRTPVEVVSGSAQLLGRRVSDAKMRLTLGLNPPKMAEEEKFLAELQNKKSPNFHKYLTAQQWNARFAPSAADEQAVVDWLNANGLTVTKRYPNRLVVDAEGNSQAVEKAFALQINNYKIGAQTEFSNDRDPVIPAHLSGILRSVGGLNSIQRTHAPLEGNISKVSPLYSGGAVAALKESNHGDGDANLFKAALKASEARHGTSTELKGLQGNLGNNPGVTNNFIDPTDIYSSYGYDYAALQAQGHCCNPTHDSGGSTPTTSIAIATAGDLAGSDIVGFHNQYPYLAYSYNTVYIDGTPSCCNGETTLDAEWAIATANSFGSYLDTAHVWVYEGANNYLSTFTDVYNQMLSDGHARVFSTSWGCAELTCASSSTMDTDHAIFNSMLGQGWTLLALSHDYGATGGCDAALRVTYPGSDPDVVSVGGTSLALYSDGTFASETAWAGGTGAGSCAANNGGSGGGCSNYFAAPGYQSPAYCGAGSRSVPDIALNAGYGQNYFFNGSLTASGGTSISTPQVAGFMAQENAYMLSLGLGYAPIGEADYELYYLGEHPSYAAHYPYYDITTGCNNNDITALYGLGYYCAGSGYDAITGWGSFNALQLSRGISAYFLGDFAAPTVTFSGPAVSHTANTWFNTEQTVSWTVTDTGSGLTPTGVSGFSQAWDNYFSDPASEPTPGTGNSFYSGPQFPNATSGYLNLSWAGQGCHYATVNAWDNTGYSSGNQYYYWLCYDTIAPAVTPTTTPASNSYGWSKVAQTTALASSDPGTGASGVTNTYYTIDNLNCSSSTLGGCSNYGGPITISTEGYHYIAYFAKDLAGNFSARNYAYSYIDKTAPVTSATLTGTHSGTIYTTAVQVTLNATDNLSGIHLKSYQVDGGAIVNYAAPFTVTALGNHVVKFYSTDYAGNVEVAKSASFSIEAPTTTTLAVTPNPAANGQTITLTAHVTAGLGATPTGSVSFLNGTTTLGTAPISGGLATLHITSLPFGSNTLTASYPGATNILPSHSAGVVETFLEKTTTSLTSSVNPSVANRSVTFTAIVAPSVSGSPTGSVQFYDGATLLSTVGVSSGHAVFTTASLPVGSDAIKAVYSGAGIYQASTSSILSEVVNKGNTNTTVAASVNPSTFGQNITFTASVSSTYGVPAGTVTFKNNGVAIGTGTLSSGHATLSTNAITPGTHTITVAYAGSSAYNASVSAGLSEVTHQTATTTTLASSLNPSHYGQNVVYTATVISGFGTPTGVVNFKDGSSIVATVALSGGHATLTKSYATGSHALTAVYTGTADYLVSTSATLTHVVIPAVTHTILSSNHNPAVHGTSVTFTAAVTASTGPIPTGSVTFKNGTATLATVTLTTSGTAAFSTTGLTVGSHPITALYNATTNDATSSSSALTQTIN